MYESWYGFTEKPFNLTPDPKYLYLSQRHAEAFAHLDFGHRERGGFVLITGEVGTGKTTLARYFLSKLGPDTHTAVVLYPALTAAELLRSILEDLHVESDAESLKGLVDALHKFLLDARSKGRNVVLLIDESQDLSAEVLEQIRLISNLETDTEKLIQIVLMGQSELRDLLARHELRQLAQRVTARYHLSPLGRPEAEAYVRHRITVAGGEGKVGFTSDALKVLQQRSGGVPRLINLICDRALLAGYAQNVRSISAQIVRKAADETLDDRPQRHAVKWHHGWAAAALTMVLAAAAFGLAPRLAKAPAEAAPDAAVATPAPTPTPPVRSERLDTLLRTASRDGSFRAANARIESLWGDARVDRTAVRTHFAQVQRLDLPVVLEMFHPSRRDTCFLAILSLSGDTAQVAVGDEVLDDVPLAQIDAHWTREAVYPWPQGETVPAEPGRRAAWLRGVLGRLGYANEDAAEAVQQFQKDAGLVPDGVAGSRTRLFLFALSRNDSPRLDSSRGDS